MHWLYPLYPSKRPYYRGTTGLALVAQYKLQGIPIAAFVGVFNVVMFVAGAAVLGKAFAFTTIISTFYHPFILGVLKGCSAPLPSPGTRCWRPSLPVSLSVPESVW